MPESNNTVKLKSTPVLLDRAIQGLQQTLLANLPWLDKAYGRGYKMVQHLDNGTKYVYPAAYIGGSEYASLTPNDNIGNFCWFDIYDHQVITAQIPAFPTHTYKGALVFWLNLQTVYQTDEFINSEEIKSEILSIITTPGAIASGIGRVAVTEVVEGIDSIYKGYTLEHVYNMRNYAEEDLQSLDKQFFMFPYYGVRFEFEITIREVCPTKKAIVSTPIIKEVTLDKNGEYFITADKEGLLLKGVRAEVKVPAAATTEEKQVAITSNGEVEILPTNADAMTKVTANVQVPPPSLEEKQVTITSNGVTEIVPTSEYGLSRVEVTTDINTLQGLDFPSIYDKKQANELNQYYKDGVEYAKQIKAENPNPNGVWLDKFKNDKKLLFMPKLDLQNLTNLQRTWSGCQRLFCVGFINATNATNMNNMFSFCSSLSGVVKINSLNATTIQQCFYNDINIEEIHMTSIAKCKDFSNAFYVYLYGNTPSTRIVHLKEWKQGNIDLKWYSLLEAESIDYNIENAIDKEEGATDRTLQLHATAGANWDANSKYQGEERKLLLTQKGIEVTW